MALGKIEAIKKFFEANGGKPLSMTELKALSVEEREQLAILAAKELGQELKAA